MCFEILRSVKELSLLRTYDPLVNTMCIHYMLCFEDLNQDTTLSSSLNV